LFVFDQMAETRSKPLDDEDPNGKDEHPHQISVNEAAAQDTNNTDMITGPGGWRELKDEAGGMHTTTSRTSDLKRGSSDDIELEETETQQKRVAAAGAGSGSKVDATSGTGAGPDGGVPGSDVVVYRVYKRRWFGLVQLTLLNVIVSWDVSTLFTSTFSSFPSSVVCYCDFFFLSGLIVCCSALVVGIACRSTVWGLMHWGKRPVSTSAGRSHACLFSPILFGIMQRHCIRLAQRSRTCDPRVSLVRQDHQHDGRHEAFTEQNVWMLTCLSCSGSPFPLFPAMQRPTSALMRRPSIG
jgi:hypothetical protein